MRHEKAVHGGRPFQCTKCLRSLKAEEEQAALVKSDHSKPDAKLAKEVRGSCFGRKSTLNRHLGKVRKSRETTVDEIERRRRRLAVQGRDGATQGRNKEQI